MRIKHITRSSKAGEIPAHYDGWLRQRFGDCFARISTDICLKLRSSVLDVARFFWRHCPACGPAPKLAVHCPTCRKTTTGYVPEDVAALAMRFEDAPQGVEDVHHVLGYDTDEGFVQGSVERDPALIQYIQEHADEWEVVKKCLGLPRGKGLHPCGFIVANNPIADWIQMTTISGTKCTALDAIAVEAAGGVKMDFLVIKILRAVQAAVTMSQERVLGRHLPDQVLDGVLVPGQRLVPLAEGGVADVWDLPADPKVFEDVCAGRTETMFQFDTHGVAKYLTHFNHKRADGTTAINSVDGMAIFTALDRPGPLDFSVHDPDNGHAHNMLVEYARRARGLPASKDLPEIVNQLVPETLGVVTFQESLQRVYQYLTGCSGPEAEEFRSNVAKKFKEKVDAAYGPFMERAGAKLGKEAAQDVWDSLKTFGQYAFNKSHATCYAVIAYACGFLKRRNFLEWWCAVLRKAEKDDVNVKFWSHVRDLVDLPDVQHSGSVWEIQHERLRAPTSLLHGIGETAHAQLVRYAPYTSLQQFCEAIRDHQEATKGPKTHKKRGLDEYETVVAPGRNALHRGMIFSLVVSGAMDSLFSPDLGLNDRLALYERTMKAVIGKRWKSPKKPYPVLDPLTHYQLKKTVLPAWSTDTRPIVAAEVAAGQHGNFLQFTNSRLRLRWSRWSQGESRTDWLPVVDGPVLERLNTSPDLPNGGWVCGVVGFVEEIRDFAFAAGTKHARDLTIDVYPGKFSFVRWPEDDGSIAADVRTVEPGDVIAAVILRNRPDRGFSIRSVEVVRKKFVKQGDDDDDAE